MFHNLLQRTRTIFLIAPLVLLGLFYRVSMNFLIFLTIFFNWTEFLDMSFKENYHTGHNSMMNPFFSSMILVLFTLYNTHIFVHFLIYSFIALHCSYKFSDRRLDRFLKTFSWTLLGLLSFCAPLQFALKLHDFSVL